RGTCARHGTPRRRGFAGRRPVVILPQLGRGTGEPRPRARPRSRSLRRGRASTRRAQRRRCGRTAAATRGADPLPRRSRRPPRTRHAKARRHRLARRAREGSAPMKEEEKDCFDLDVDVEIKSPNGKTETWKQTAARRKKERAAFADAVANLTPPAW